MTENFEVEIQILELVEAIWAVLDYGDNDDYILTVPKGAEVDEETISNLATVQINYV